MGAALYDEAMLEKYHTDSRNNTAQTRLLIELSRDCEFPCAIALCLLRGWGGMIKNKTKAWQILTEESNQGCVPAISLLGDCYYYGEGVDEDEAKAAELYTRAAKQGAAEAQFNLGICYTNGEGVQEDLLKALEWYSKAADQGHLGAKYNLGVVYENNVTVLGCG